MDILDAFEALLEVLLHGPGILGLSKDLQQVVVRHEVEAREHHPKHLPRNKVNCVHASADFVRCRKRLTRY